MKSMITSIKTYKEIGRRYRRYVILIGILFAVIFLAYITYIKGTYFGDFNSAIASKPLLEWTITPWQMNGQAGWEEQPVILVEGQRPFYADHPQAYIEKLVEMYKNPAMERGQFQTRIGELRDGLENNWEVKP